MIFCLCYNFKYMLEVVVTLMLALTWVAVACPINSIGSLVVNGCLCPVGYTGTITPTASNPFYNANCAGIACNLQICKVCGNTTWQNHLFC